MVRTLSATFAANAERLDLVVASERMPWRSVFMFRSLPNASGFFICSQSSFEHVRCLSEGSSIWRH